MIDMSDNISILPQTKEGQNRNIEEVFFNYFNQETIKKMKNILKQDRYIPQETLSIIALRCHTEGVTES